MVTLARSVPLRPQRTIRKPNAALSEAREFAKRILNDPEYRMNLLDRARKGTLPQSIETLLYYYGFGRPIITVEEETTVNFNGEDLTQLSNEELEQRAQRLAMDLRKAKTPTASAH